MGAITIEIFYDGYAYADVFTDDHLDMSWATATALSGFSLRFEDLSEGLYVEAMRFTPDNDDADKVLDPNEPPVATVRESTLLSNARYCLVPRDWVGRVDEIRYNKRVVFERVGSHLVNLMRIGWLSQVYLDEEYSAGILGCIASLYHAVRPMCERRLAAGVRPEGDINGAVASELGVERAVLEMALEFEAARESGPEDEGGEEARICPTCQAELPEGASSCPACGDAGGKGQALLESVVDAELRRGLEDGEGGDVFDYSL